LTTQPTVDHTNHRPFLGKVVADTSGMAVTMFKGKNKGGSWKMGGGSVCQEPLLLDLIVS